MDNSLSEKSYWETYRSGHNGADSKSVREKSHVGSNPTVSAKKKTLETLGFRGFSIWLLSEQHGNHIKSRRIQSYTVQIVRKRQHIPCA